MPTSAGVLEELTRISREYAGLAAVWHVGFGAFLLALTFGWRPPRRWASASLAAPLCSVGVVAWITGNPFNASIFLAAAIAILALGVRESKEAVALAATGRRWAGAAWMAFGWFYPHFLQDSPSVRFLWAAPLGLIPCPTLSLLIGLAFLVGGIGTRSTRAVLGSIGMLYGLLGWLWLGVAIDALLVLGAALLLGDAVGRPEPRVAPGSR